MKILTTQEEIQVHLAKLVKSINDLGILFSVWNNADGSNSQVKEFTSLLG